MILRNCAISCVRINFCQCRLISMTSIKKNDDSKNLPSSKYFLEMVEKKHLTHKLARSGKKPFEVMLEKPIIVKNFFISEIESEEITFPVTLTANAVQKWQKTNEQISIHLSNILNEKKNKQFKTLNKFNLFGYNVPKTFGGKGYTQTERSLASETEAQNVAIAIVLNGHRMVCEAITAYGTDDQCEKYLPKLSNGKIIGTTAFQECDDKSRMGMNTCAEYDDEDEEWCLNGIFQNLLERF